MKKLILLMLVVMVPFLTYSQKRTKKGTDKTETKDKSSNAKVNFMIIKGVEVDMRQEGMSLDEIKSDESNDDVSLDNLMKRHIKPMSRFYFSFDVGGFSEESQELMAASREFRTIAQAVNKAAEYGWEFVNATIIIDGVVKIHYYHMKR